MSAFPVFLRALGHWWRDWLNLAALNLAWMLCWLTLVLGPPATFAAYRIANNFAHERTLYPREIPGMMRRYFLQSWLWFLLQLAVAAGVLLNLHFYAGLGALPAGGSIDGAINGSIDGAIDGSGFGASGDLAGGLGSALQGATLVVAALWLTLQLYLLPYLMEQGRPGLGLALRNSLLTVLASPLYTLVMAGLVAGLLLLCFRIPFLLLFGVPMLIAVTGSHAVIDRLDRYGKRKSKSG